MLTLLLLLPAHAGPHTALVGHQGDPAPLLATAAALGGHARACLGHTPLCIVDFPGAPPLDALRAAPGVRYAELDAIMPVQQPASYPDAKGTDDCEDLWELDLLQAEDVWELADGSGADPVAIEDSGFLLTHEELSGTAAYTWDYGDGDAGVEVVYGVTVPGHGTFIAGMISADGANDAGRAGLAPGGSIAYQKIADGGSALYYSYAIDALGELADGDAGGARIVSYSLAGTSEYTPFREAVEALGDAGVLMVAAAANCSTAGCREADNDRYPEYPASYDGDHILAVAGTLSDDTLNPYSHYGETSVDLAAPGDDLCSLYISSGSAYTTEGGTSYATPIVAAAASLVWELHPDLTPEEVAYLIKASVEPSVDLADKVASGGRLDVLDALLAPLPDLALISASDVALAPTGTVEVDVGTRASGGTASLVLLHDPSVSVTDAGGWSLSRVEPGADLTVGGVTSTLSDDQAATLIEGGLGAHEATTVTLTLKASASGTTDATLRLVIAGDGEIALGAPLDGDLDGTGAPAEALVLDAVVTDTGGDEGGGEEGGDSGGNGGEEGGADDSAPVETDDSAATDDTGAGITEDKPTPEGCACGAAPTPASGGWGLLLGLGVLLRRRVRSGR